MAQKARRRGRQPSRQKTASRGKRTRRRKGQGERLASLLWFLGGLTLGALLLLPVFYLGGEGETELPTSGEDSSRAEGEAPTETADSDAPTRNVETPTQGQRSPSREGDSGMDYRFYTLLPEMEVDPAPQEDPPDPPQEEGATEPVPETPEDEAPTRPEGAEGDYLLQVGSFQEHRPAEELKARLALKGLDAEVVEAQLQDRGTWYRVRLGPFPDRAKAEDVRSRLAEGGMDSMILQQ